VNIDSPQFQGLDGMFKTRFGGNAFFYFLKSVTEALGSFGQLSAIRLLLRQLSPLST
jgi:hypothetical protein